VGFLKKCTLHVITASDPRMQVASVNDEIYCDMPTESQNCESSRDSHCWGTTLKTRQLLGRASIYVYARIFSAVSHIGKYLLQVTD
jgi:hypothetical protein